MGVDYLVFRQTYRNSLMHSPKGTTWKDHKYIKIENGRYIYETAKNKISRLSKDVDIATKDTRRKIGNKMSDISLNVKYGVQDLIDGISDEVSKSMREFVVSVLKEIAKEEIDEIGEETKRSMRRGYSFIDSLF